MNVEWIPVDEELPIVELVEGLDVMTSDYILLSFTNYPLIAIGEYNVDAEGNGAFYLEGSRTSCASNNLFVNAWMPMIPPYRDDEFKEPERKRDDVIVIEE